MKKILFVLLLTLILPAKVYGADYKVICDNNGCTGPATATFYEDNLVAGETLTRTIEIKSAYGQTLNASLTATKLSNTDDDLLDQIQVTIYGLNGRTRFTGSFEELFNTPLVDLGSLFAFGSREVVIEVSLDQFGNAYQTKKIWFNMPIQINVQGQAHDQPTDSSSTSTSPSTPPVIKLLPTSQLWSILDQVKGEASPSTRGQVTTDELPTYFLNKLKTYLRLWPWLLFLFPLWLIFLLFRKRKKR